MWLAHVTMTPMSPFVLLRNYLKELNGEDTRQEMRPVGDSQGDSRPWCDRPFHKDNLWKPSKSGALLIFDRPFLLTFVNCETTFKVST